MSPARRERLRNYARAVPPPFDAPGFAAALDAAEEIRTQDGESVYLKHGKFLARVLRHGSCVLYDASGPDPLSRRVAAFDPGGQLVERLSWEPGGPLAEAMLRLPAGGWVRLEPRAEDFPLWGASDRVSRAPALESQAAERLTILRSVPYEAVDFIPPGAEPARLVQGSGSVVLNFLAELLIEQGTDAVRYRGPYPSDQLFDALQESFRVRGDGGARERFTRGATDAAFAGEEVEPPVDFAPAPFELCLLGEKGGVFLRDGPEKCFFEGRAYARAESYPLRPTRARRLWREDPGEEGSSPRFVAGLWLLGAPLAVHAGIDLADQQFVPHESTTDAFEGAAPAGEEWKNALGSLVQASAAGPLRAALGESLEALTVSWGDVRSSTVVLRENALFLSRPAAKAFAARSQKLSFPERARLALAFLSELAAEAAPSLLGAAQERLTLADGSERARLLSREALAHHESLLQKKAAALPLLCRALSEGKGLP